MEKFMMNGDWVILREHTEYSRTASGKSWKTRPDEVKRDILTPREYGNFVNSISFYNNWGDGASCRANRGYTAAGYIPTTIHTVSPYKLTKHVDHFTFIFKYDLLKTAGYRERDIVENAETWSEEFTQHGYAVTFKTATNEATFLNWEWVN